MLAPHQHPGAATSSQQHPQRLSAQLRQHRPFRRHTRSTWSCCSKLMQADPQPSQHMETAECHGVQRRTLLAGAAAFAAAWTPIRPAKAGEKDTNAARSAAPATDNTTSAATGGSNKNESSGSKSSSSSSGEVSSSLRGSPAQPDATTGNTTASGKAAISTTLSVEKYVQLLTEARRKAWPMVARLISEGNWVKLSQLVVQQPFDDVRQAAFYIPWALLQQDDYTAAVESRKAYVRLLDHIHDMATVALASADAPGPNNAVQVQQAFLLLNASVESFLSTVPERYISAAAGKL